MKPKALDKASGLFAVVALVAALSAPAHLFAYADDSANAAEAPHTSKQIDDGEDATLSEQNDQEGPEKEGKLGIAEAVRTASESSGMLDKGAHDIPIVTGKEKLSMLNASKVIDDYCKSAKYPLPNDFPYQ